MEYDQFSSPRIRLGLLLVLELVDSLFITNSSRSDLEVAMRNGHQEAVAVFDIHALQIDIKLIDVEVPHLVYVVVVLAVTNQFVSWSSTTCSIVSTLCSLKLLLHSLFIYLIDLVFKVTCDTHLQD